MKDVRAQLAALSPSARAALPPTRFAIFVVHNKDKTGGKKGHLDIVTSDKETISEGVAEGVRYYAGDTVGDVWVNYPWEQE